MTEKLIRLTILLPESAHERLRLAAFSQHKGMSLVAREAIEAVIGDIEQPKHGGNRHPAVIPDKPAQPTKRTGVTVASIATEAVYEPAIPEP